MKAEVVEWYAPDLESRTFTCGCGWSGSIEDMSHELFRELMEYDCPTCDTMLVIRSFPTIDNVRDAAARGDENAKEELESAERAESRRKRAEPSELKSIDQLPELGLSAPTVFVWDQEERDGDNWAVVRVAGNGLEVWRELAYYEGWRRAIAIRDLLAARYGDAFAALVRTVGSGIWLTGDDFRAVDLPLADEADAPWLIDSDDIP